MNRKPHTLRRSFHIIVVDEGRKEGRKYADNQLLPTEDHLLKS
jgi:hypothetical protein